MGPSLVWTLGFILLSVICKQTKGDHVTLEAPEQSVYLRDTVTLLCTGPAQRIMNFYKNRSPVQLDTKYQLQQISNIYYLIITSVSDSDKGFYSCGINEETQSTVKELKVTEKRRRVHLTSANTAIPVGGSVTLSCDVEGWEGKYDWFRGNPGSVYQRETSNSISVSHGGVYRCRGEDDHIFTEISNEVTVSGDHVTLEAPEQSVYLRDSVTLRCTGPAQRNLYFYKDGSSVKNNIQHQSEHISATTTTTTTTTVELKISLVSKSDEGLFSCGINEKTQSDKKSLRVTEKQRSVRLTTSNNTIPVGGSVTLSCDVEGFTGKYGWFRGNSDSDPKETLREDSSHISVSKGGVYICRGQDQFILTPESNSVTVWETVPKRATLTPNWSEIFPGERLTLRCETEHRGNTEWTYHWSRNRLNSPPTTQEYTVDRVTSSHGGRYRCRGERFPYYSQWSSYIIIKVLAKPKATVSGETEVQSGGSVTLSCSVTPSSSGWKYYWNKNEQLFKDGSYEQQISVSERGEYQCRAGRGDPLYYTEYSQDFRVKAVGDIILVSPVRPVTEGQPVSLGCKLKTGTFLSSVCFYKNGKLIQNGTKTEFNISAVSKSDEGFYKCEGQRQQQQSSPQTLTSAESWLSVKTVSKEQSSSFPVMLVIGPVCAVVLLILLLLLWRYRKTKDRGCNRTETGLGGEVQENQRQLYSALLHGDVGVYESITGSRNNDNDRGFNSSRTETGLGGEAQDNQQQVYSSLLHGQFNKMWSQATTTMSQHKCNP